MSHVNDGPVEAAVLAEKVVVCEARLQTLRNLKAPAVVIDQAVRVLGVYTERLMKNSDAETLLAQARVIVQSRTQRRRYLLEKTLLGKCVAHIDVLRMEASYAVDPEDTSWPPDGQDMVEVLTEAISAGDSYKIAFALGQVLGSIVDELEERDDDLLKLGPAYDLSKVN
jgi:hypothetical protein